MDPLKFLISLLLHLLLLHAQASHSVDANLIRLGSSLSPASRNSSWHSPSGLFAFGFYQQGRGLAVGIWLAGGDGAPKNTVVWTANRDDAPVCHRTTINFTADGRLILWKERGEMRAIAELPEPVTAASASMLDSGNFVIYDNESKVVWQSFDHPTDTVLGGQKLNVNSQLVSSASDSDHSSGRFFLVMQSDENLVAYPVNRSTSMSAYWASDTYIYRESERRSDIFLYLDQDTGDLSLGYTNASRAFSIFSILRKPDNETRVVYRAALEPDGNLVLYSHRFGAAGDPKVVREWAALGSQCDNGAFCGLNSYCSRNGASGNCNCFPGFLPPSDSKVPDCHRGSFDEDACLRENSTLSYKMTAKANIEWGGTSYAEIVVPEEDCLQNCLKDCDCWGALFSNGTCSKYKLPLMSAILNTQNSVTAFVKSTSPANSYLNPSSPKTVVDREKALVLTLGLSLGSFAVLFSVLAIISFFLYRRRAQRYQVFPGTACQALNGEFTPRSFSYSELEKATDGFEEILGTNPSGAVYKGTLTECNKSVAVKRLENVAEGESKFRREMTAVGRTHHRNLVQLLGFCIEGSKKLLVYEFMKNGSLADFLFKMESRPSWNDRVRISLDIARGILYLHEECESRIIHCNIKPQNILLNDSWTAKISDFGLAKLLMTNQSGAYTGAKGTSSYMAPEWQKTSLITEKADVYSFGVVLLEIVCCQSMQLNAPTADEALRFHWVYYCFLRNDLKCLVGDEVVDMKVLERMVKVGLLCVQDDANLRPAMKNVILMLEGTMNIPEPQPWKYL